MLCLLAFRPCVCRRLQQLQASGDRKDILAMDGNSKLHRRTCGVPYAEIVQSPHVNKLLLRGCSCKPLPKDTLCQKHAEDRDRLVAPMYADIGRHRLKKALHNPGDVSFLEIQRSGFRSWEPASVVPESCPCKVFRRTCQPEHWNEEPIFCRFLACSPFLPFMKNIALFAAGDCGAKSPRGEKWNGMRPRRPKTFLASWSSAQPRASSSCQTTKSQSNILQLPLGQRGTFSLWARQDCFLPYRCQKPIQTLVGLAWTRMVHVS